MGDKGVQNVTIVIAIVVVVGTVVGGYILMSEDEEGGGTGGVEGSEVSSVKIITSSNQLNVGDNLTGQLSVTNKENEMMIIQKAEVDLYQDNQLVNTLSIENQLKATDIPPGENKIIYSNTDPFYESGTFEFKASVTTNYGTLRDSATVTVTK